MIAPRQPNLWLVSAVLLGVCVSLAYMAVRLVGVALDGEAVAWAILGAAVVLPASLFMNLRKN